MAALEASMANLSPEQLAAACEARNGSCSALLVTLGHVSDADAAVLGELSVAAVWRMRGVSRAFRGWCGSALAAMPRVVAVGGRLEYGLTIATAVSLDLATLAWGGGGTVPDLPTPCTGFSLGQLPGGRLVVAGGASLESRPQESRESAAAFEWAPGRAAWTPLPPMGSPRAYAVAAVLSDGRMLVASGYDDDGHDLALVEVLAADGSGWAALPPMATARYGAVAGRLPGGQVIVAGGAAGDDDSLASAELWDPATGAWTALPPMAQARHTAAGCVLPSGRFAVLGGYGDAAGAAGVEDAEAFDPVSRVWQPLPPMPRDVAAGTVVAVAGGLLVVGGNGHADAMLFDEEIGRWFTLPGQMSAGRAGHGLTTVPAP
jgi:hypothetical protein